MRNKVTRDDHLSSRGWGKVNNRLSRITLQFIFLYDNLFQARLRQEWN